MGITRGINARWVLVALLVVALVLAACTDDNGDKENDANGSPPESTPTAESVDLDTDSGLNLDTGFDAPGPVGNEGPVSDLPGCSDPDAEDCPVPLDVPLDGEASAGGVTILYASRYFDATTHPDAASGEPLIEIAPSERNKFPYKATFSAYFAESIDAVLAELDSPETAEWSTDTLSGIVGVSRDDTVDPPVTTTRGAFDTADGRVIVLEAVTTGDYGWDFHVILYENMLAGLVIE